jgi:hypothetical protein
MPDSFQQAVESRIANPKQESRPDQIKQILREGRKARTKEEQEDVMRKLAELSKDYSSEEYPKMKIDEFMGSDAKKSGLSPKEMLESYYGEALPKEIIRAGNYNIDKPTIDPESFTKIFDTIRAQKDEEYGSSYSVERDGSAPTAAVSSGRAAEISEKNAQTYRDWLNGSDPELQKRAAYFFKANSIDPTKPYESGKSVLKHEIGHHITKGDREATLPIRANNYSYAASNSFEDFGEHTGMIDETTQALSRLQREWYKNKGTRINNPKQFMSIVNSGEIPEFLSSEGRRALIYARNLKEVRDSNQSDEKKKAAEEALKAISEMAPAVVQNKKQYGSKPNIV